MASLVIRGQRRKPFEKGISKANPGSTRKDSSASLRLAPIPMTMENGLQGGKEFYLLLLFILVVTFTTCMKIHVSMFL